MTRKPSTESDVPTQHEAEVELISDLTVAPADGDAVVGGAPDEPDGFRSGGCKL